MIHCRDILYLLGSDKAYFSHFSSSKADPSIPFDAIAGILRLSNKYNIPPIRRRSIQELKRHLPRTLLDFDTVRCTSVLIKAIILTRECNTLDILLCAF